MAMVPARRKRIEDRLQIDTITYLRLVLDRRRYLIFSIRNEARRSLVEGVIAKRMGLVPGMPDICILEIGGLARFIELKSPNGRVSPDQADIHAQFALRGIPYAVCRSLDDVTVAITAWGVLDRQPAMHH